MNSSSPPPPSEHGRAEDAREDLVFRLYVGLVTRYFDLQARERREKRAHKARVEWKLARARLEDRLIASEELLDQLATLAYLGRSAHPLRVLFVGPPGAGKSHVAAALAYALDGRTITLDATSLVESGWAGTSLHEALGAAGNYLSLPGAAFIIEEIDKLRCHPEATGNSVAKYRNQQSMYLTLLDRAGHVMVGEGAMASGHVHVLLTGSFADASWAQRGASVSREDLVAYGMLPELVDRIDHIITLTAPAWQDLARILQKEIEDAPGILLRMAVDGLGYSLRVDAAVYAYVARALQSQVITGTRAGRAAIEDGIQRVLARAIRDQLPVGSILHIAPDDIRLPPAREDPPRGRGGGGRTGWRPVRG